MPALRRRWTAADVRALMDESRAWPRYELIGGELLVTPAPGNRHQIAVTELWNVLDDYLRREPVGVAVISPADIELKPDTISQPDVFVIPRGSVVTTGDTFPWAAVHALLLAVEVISPGSVKHDRVTKRDHYMEAGVPEYWIVDLDAHVVERWTPAQETPTLCRDELVWMPAGATSPLVLDIPGLLERVKDKVRLISRPD